MRVCAAGPLVLCLCARTFYVVALGNRQARRECRSRSTSEWPVQEDLHGCEYKANEVSVRTANDQWVVGRHHRPSPALRLSGKGLSGKGPKWEGPYWEGPDWEMGIIGVSVRAARRSVGRGQAPPPLPPLGPCAAPCA